MQQGRVRTELSAPKYLEILGESYATLFIQIHDNKN